MKIINAYPVRYYDALTWMFLLESGKQIIAGRPLKK
jgi:hypothetical protein